MEFSIAVNMSRVTPDEDMQQVARQALEVVKLADQAGFDVAWAAEHHTIEYTIAPNPLTLLMHWAAHTDRIRLGTAVLVAPYWHPIRLAGEVALVDQLTQGRLEVGMARGAFQYEFDRLGGGMPQQEGGAYLREMIPVVKQLWEGDYAHDGQYWRFPTATSVPKPFQQPHPPLWVAARGPETYDWAIKNNLNIMATPLSKPFSEVENLASKLTTALTENPGHTRPKFMVLRSTHVFNSHSEWAFLSHQITTNNRRFDALFSNSGEVVNGFTQLASRGTEQGTDAGSRPELQREGTMYGTPAELVERLERHAEVGVDQYCVGIPVGLPHAMIMRSLELFATDVMPHFSKR